MGNFWLIVTGVLEEISDGFLGGIPGFLGKIPGINMLAESLKEVLVKSRNKFWEEAVLDVED